MNERWNTVDRAILNSLEIILVVEDICTAIDA